MVKETAVLLALADSAESPTTHGHPSVPNECAQSTALKVAVFTTACSPPLSGTATDSLSCRTSTLTFCRPQGRGRHSQPSVLGHIKSSSLTICEYTRSKSTSHQGLGLAVTTPPPALDHSHVPRTNFNISAMEKVHSQPTSIGNSSLISGRRVNATSGSIRRPLPQAHHRSRVAFTWRRRKPAKDTHNE